MRRRTRTVVAALCLALVCAIPAQGVAEEGNAAQGTEQVGGTTELWVKGPKTEVVKRESTSYEAGAKSGAQQATKATGSEKLATTGDALKTPFFAAALILGGSCLVLGLTGRERR